jgi:hypothetical protein
VAGAVGATGFTAVRALVPFVRDTVPFAPGRIGSIGIVST